jgi:hypothetical protein
MRPAATRRPASAVLVLAATLSLAGCAGDPTSASVSRFESFDAEDVHSRLIDAPPAQACEGARRALLSQGYQIAAADGENVLGRKSFQPARESHVVLEIRFVCASDGSDGSISTVFVSGTEEHYSLKKASSSASVGVGMLGSVSVPFLASDEALVRVGSHTITQPQFYDRLFALVHRHVERSPDAAAVSQAEGSGASDPLRR